MPDAIPPEPPTEGEIAADAPVLTALHEAARAENRAAFGKVDTAAAFYTRWMDRRDCATERHVNTWAHAALVEITTRLACSTTTAEHYTELGTALSERLPETRAAFAAGEIDYPKAWRIATATGGFSDAVVAEVEAKAVLMAGRYAPARFTTEIDALLISTAPDEYAELRKDAEKWQRRIRRRGVGTLTRIEADLSPEEAAAVWQRVGEVAANVCADDPRSKQHRLVDAYLAIVHGEDHLTCTCERPDCTADPIPASRRKPLVQITIDAATLLGLRSEPAFLPGHGPIDPELARRIAHDSHWQGMLIELLDLAVAAGILTAEQANSERTRQSHPEATVEHEPAPATDAEPTVPDTEPDTEPATTAEPVDLDAETDTEPDVEPAAATDPEPDPEPEPAPVTRTEPAEPAATTNPGPDTESITDAQETPHEPSAAAADPENADPTPDAEPAAEPQESAPQSQVESDLHTRMCHPLLASFVARGTRRPSGYVPSCAPKPALAPVTRTDVYVDYVRVLDTHPGLAVGTYPDGHGGLQVPPPGALTYRPSAEVAALVRARDRHCRFPHCSMPAERCQIDHIRNFDHDSPHAGGWTIESNLQCVCAFHHELKTVGLWRARALPGMAVLWTGPRGDRHLTLPAGGLTPVPAATDLTPDVGGGRQPPDRIDNCNDPPF